MRQALESGRCTKSGATYPVLKRRVYKMNSCDLNLGLFTEEVLDLVCSRYSIYIVYRVLRIVILSSGGNEDPYIRRPNYHPTAHLFVRRSKVPPSLVT